MTVNIERDIEALLIRMSVDLGTNGKPKKGEPTRVINDAGESQFLHTLLAEMGNESSSGSNEDQ